MTREELEASILARFASIQKAQNPVKDYVTLRLKGAEDLIPVVKYLKEVLGFAYLEIVTAVDWLGPVGKEGFIRNPNFNVFLPEGATPQIQVTATAGVNYRPVFDLLWCLANIPQRLRLFLRLEVPRDQPVVPSLVSLFKAADWQERETFDLLGIRFEGHPNLTKILTPDFIKGFPLRKDYVHVKDQYDE